MEGFLFCTSISVHILLLSPSLIILARPEASASQTQAHTHIRTPTRQTKEQLRKEQSSRERERERESEVQVHSSLRSTSAAWPTRSSTHIHLLPLVSVTNCCHLRRQQGFLGALCSFHMQPISEHAFYFETGTLQPLLNWSKIGASSHKSNLANCLSAPAFVCLPTPRAKAIILGQDSTGHCAVCTNC